MFSERESSPNHAYHLAADLCVAILAILNLALLEPPYGSPVEPIHNGCLFLVAPIPSSDVFSSMLSFLQYPWI